VAAAAADRVAEGPALEAEAAAGARGRQKLGLDEERPHQRGPEEEEPEDEEAVHLLRIGRRGASVKILS